MRDSLRCVLVSELLCGDRRPERVRSLPRRERLWERSRAGRFVVVVSGHLCVGRQDWRLLRRIFERWQDGRMEERERRLAFSLVGLLLQCRDVVRRDTGRHLELDHSVHERRLVVA